ncbi:MAG: hypothetical protein RLZZ347_325 [Candidatus Parcubacteria bacterium]|jgi:hypothetical protein
MQSSLVLNGKTYISARRGAEIAGYSGDYVGQLCRAGKIDAEMVGKSWFVSESSLVSHKKEQERLTEEMRERMSRTRKLALSAPEPKVEVKKETVASALPVKFVSSGVTVPVAKPVASYVGKIGGLLVVCLMFLIIGEGSQIKDSAVVASVGQAIAGVYTHAQLSLVSLSIAPEVMPVLPLRGLENFSEFFPTTDGGVATGAFTVGQVSNVLASAIPETYVREAQTGSLASDYMRTKNSVSASTRFASGFGDMVRGDVDITVSVQNYFDAVVAYGSDRLNQFGQQYQFVTDSASQYFIARGVAYGMAVDDLSRSLQHVGITFAEFSDTASLSMQHVGTQFAFVSDTTSATFQNIGLVLAHISTQVAESMRLTGTLLAQFSDYSSGVAQSVGGQFAQRSDMISTELQNTGKLLSQKKAVSEEVLQLAGVGYADFFLSSSDTLQHVGAVFAQGALRLSGEFFVTGRTLAYASDFASASVQEMGRDFVSETLFVKDTASLLLAQVTHGIATGVAQATDDFLAQTVSAGGTTRLVSGTSQLAQVISDQFKTIATLTYESAQSLLVPKASFAFLSRWFTHNSSSVAEPVSGDLVSMPHDTAVGIVVSPKDTHQSTDAVIRQIKNSFSDDVEVHPDQSGSAGIIKPVFKKATDDEYVYVLVPLKK